MDKLSFLLIRLVKKRLIDYNKSVNWIVFTLITVFTIGSWIDINGMWCQLPLMVHELPEGWKLPSILTVVTQMAQIGPIVFLILKCICPKRVSFVVVIFIILGIGAVSCLLLAFFWNSTAFIFDEKRSIGLYALTLSLGILDGTSSVTFLPYIGTNYKKEYIIPNYIGESLSAMIPSVLGLIQGIGKNTGCRWSNTTSVNKSGVIIIIKANLEPIPLDPLFSVSIYFILLFVLLIICTISFALLQFLSISKKVRKQNAKMNPFGVNMRNESFQDFDSNLTSIKEKKLILSTKQSDIEEYKSYSKLKENFNQVIEPTPTPAEQSVLLTVILILSFFAYGVLPGLQSYATLPYGNNIFHLSTNLGFVCLPFVIFFSIWCYKLSTTRIVIEFVIAVLLGVYVTVIAAFSPCPPMLESGVGAAIVTICWVLNTCLFMRVRCCIAAKLEVFGQKVLIILGTFTMMGQMVGGVIMYLCVNTYGLFKDAPPCENIIDFCYLKR